MAESILSIDKLAIHDDSIIKIDTYPYSPYTTKIGESDEIRIAIQSKDSYLLPSDSYLYMQITCTTAGVHAADDKDVRFVFNFPTFLFSDARYELNGVEIDRVRNVGRASSMKLYAASRLLPEMCYAQFCKNMENTSARSERNAQKVYDIYLPLSTLFGFADDYKKIILNCKHELILNRARQSLDCTEGGGAAATAATVSIALNKIEWKMPHIVLSDRFKLNMLNYLSKNRKITVQHRAFDMIEYPNLPTTTSLVWSVKTASHVNRPRFVVVGFQTNRKAVRVNNASKFDPCNISDIRLFLNSQIYPYHRNDINISLGYYAEIYHQYFEIQKSYYGGIDTSRADESLINSAVDIRIDIKASEAFADNTAAYCLIIYDNAFTYSPFDGIVTRKI